MKLRWVTVVLPGVAIGLLDLWTDHDWDEVISEPVNTLIVPVLLLSVAVTLAAAAFRRVDRLADDVREREAELARTAAVQEERERIAREMHDGLAQVLGYVNTKAQAVEELLATGHTQEARTHLAQLSSAARSVYVDVREAILGLTRPVATRDGIVRALEDYAAQYVDASKVAVSVDAEPATRTLRLSPDVETQVFRIVQEALTNVRKHAAAARVHLGVALRSDGLVVTVADDGVGFTPGRAAADWPHYGMQGIRARAAAIGATADWRSTLGGGTSFTLTLPAPASAAVAS